MGNVPPSARRRPPPPPTTTNTARVRNRRLYLRGCKKVNSSNSLIDSLPDELLIEILVCLPADEIYDNARLVCRRWCHLIHTDAFMCAHLQRTTSGLLLNSHDDLHIGSSPVLLTATTQGQVKMSKLSCRINFPIMCSCNGLALCLRRGGYRGRGGITPFIFNPATKCAFNLPSFPVKEGIGQLFYGLGIAYATASMAYKVVGTYRKLGITHFVILTVGVDKTWRHVSVEGLSPEVKLLWSETDFLCPLITRCFLYWVSGNHVLCFNVETEIFTMAPTPPLMFPKEYYCLSTGEYLSLLIPCGDNWSWEVWEMKPETWEWKKIIPGLDLKAHKFKIQEFNSRPNDVLEPFGWVRYPKLLAFFFNGIVRSCIVYNLDTDEIGPIELPTTANRHHVLQHRNSLVWLENF